MTDRTDCGVGSMTFPPCIMGLYRSVGTCYTASSYFIPVHRKGFSDANLIKIDYVFTNLFFLFVGVHIENTRQGEV
jgi:hypothetical protein